MELEEDQRRIEDQETMERLQENAQWVMEQIQRDRGQQVHDGTQWQNSSLEERLRQGKEVIEQEIEDMISKIRKHQNGSENNQNDRGDNSPERSVMQN